MIYVVGSILGAVCYRLGGMAGMNTKCRDFGVPLVFLGTVYMAGHWSFYAVGAAVLLFGALTIYWDWLFGGEDNFYMHGFMCGVSMFPLYWAGVHWWAVLSYAVILAASMGALNTFITRVKVPLSDWLEELFRGFIIIMASQILWMI